jgi:hypothetical protein
MAEVLGIITSGLAIGQLIGSITSSIIKLKEHWDQVKDAPGEIQSLLLEIDSKSYFEPHRARSASSGTLGYIPEYLFRTESEPL